jgi:ribosomal protein L37AE/L43A
MEYRQTQCDTCGGDLRRTHRSLTEKMLYVSVHRCSFCEVQMVRARAFTFWLARRCKCPNYGNTRLDRMLERDWIEMHYFGPLVLAGSLLRARFYHCPECDVHFHERGGGTVEAAKGTAS